MDIEILQQHQRGLNLEYLTIGWNSLESVTAVAAGLFAGSTALVGFGFDLIIEVSSVAIILGRLVEGEHRELGRSIYSGHETLAAPCFLSTLTVSQIPADFGNLSPNAV